MENIKYRKIFTRMVSALLLAVIAPMVNAAEPHNLRQDGQLLQAARAASGNAADPAFRTALGLSGDEGLDILRSYADGLGGSVTRYRQTYRGVPVWGEQIVIGRDAAGRAGRERLFRAEGDLCGASWRRTSFGMTCCVGVRRGPSPNHAVS